MISISSFSPTPDMPPKFPSLDFTQLGFNAILACSIKVSEAIQDNLLCKQESYFEEMISNVWINVCHNNFATVSSMNKTLGSNKLNLDSNPTFFYFSTNTQKSYVQNDGFLTIAVHLVASNGVAKGVTGSRTRPTGIFPFRLTG